MVFLKFFAQQCQQSINDSTLPLFYNLTRTQIDNIITSSEEIVGPIIYQLIFCDDIVTLKF